MSDIRRKFIRNVLFVPQFSELLGGLHVDVHQRSCGEQNEEACLFHMSKFNVPMVYDRFAKTRMNSPTLHACAEQPRGAWGGSASKISDICPTPASFRCPANGVSNSRIRSSRSG